MPRSVCYFEMGLTVVCLQIKVYPLPKLGPVSTAQIGPVFYLKHPLTFCCSCCWYCWASCWALLIWEVVEGLFDLSVWVAWVLMAFRFKRSTNKKWINIVTIYWSIRIIIKMGFIGFFCNCTLHRTWYNNKRMKSFMWKSNTVCKNQKCTLIEKTFVKSICSEIYLWKSWFHGIFLKKYYDQISQIATL